MLPSRKALQNSWASHAVRLDGVVKAFDDATVIRVDELSIRPGELFAMLGPSGSGKTTILRMIAGLERPSTGHIFLDQQEITHWEPAARNFAMVFQSYALYPHMTVRQNIDFPLRMTRLPRLQRREAVMEAARQVRIEHLLDRLPDQLSGGQQQRCALAKAIARKPRCFLLDEPISSLDANLRFEMRSEIRALQRSLGITMIYVTHDQDEAAELADRIGILSEGRVAQVGSPTEVFSKPVSLDVARFLGSARMILLAATVEGDEAMVSGAGTLKLPLLKNARRDVIIGFGHGALRQDENGLNADVLAVTIDGYSLSATVRIGGTVVSLRLSAQADVQQGKAISLTIDPSRLCVFDAVTGTDLVAGD